MKFLRLIDSRNILRDIISEYTLRKFPNKSSIVKNATSNLSRRDISKPTDRECIKREICSTVTTVISKLVGNCHLRHTGGDPMV